MILNISSWLAQELHTHPYHIFLEFLFGLYVVWRLIARPEKPREDRPKVDEDDIIATDWHPKDLAIGTVRPDPHVVSKQTERTVTVDGVECLNFASFNFLSLACSDKAKQIAKDTINEFGVGTCGPRGFYGTITPHLQLEEKIAQFCGTERSIVYAYGYTTISSIIPCFASRGDVIIVDKAVNYAVEHGVGLSRSTISFFEHNNMQELANQIEQAEKKLQKLKSKKMHRKYIACEGLYRNTGQLCKFPELLTIARKYKYRIIMDDTYGFGAIGENGKGTPQHYGLPISDVDIYIGQLSSALGTVGGFCTGLDEMVSHQTLSSTGYCYSASLPVCFANCAKEAIAMLEQDSSIVEKLHQRVKFARSTFEDTLCNSGVEMAHEYPSPIFHFYAAGNSDRQQEIVQDISENALKQGLAVSATQISGMEAFPPRPSIRLTVCLSLTNDDIVEAARVLKALFGAAA